MKKFERTMGIIAILAVVLKLIYFAGSGLLLTLSLLILSIFYFIFSGPLFNKLKLKRDAKSEIKQKSNIKRITGSIFLGFSLSLIVIGILFKMQIWEGAAFQLYVGLTTTVIIFIVVVILYLGNKDEFYLRILKRIAIIGGIGLVIYLIPTTTFIDIYYRNDPEYAELYKKLLQDPENPGLQEQMREKTKQMYGDD